MLEQQIHTVTSTASTVVAPTHDLVTYILKNIEPATAPENYARAGRVFDLQTTFPLSRSTSKSFTVLTGPTGMQFQYYQILSNASDVYAELIENATVVVGATSLSAYNVNRNFSDTHSAAFNSVTSFTGGTTVNAEYITASKSGGGEHSYTKVITLKPDTRYVFKFTEMSGNNDPTIFFQLGFAERYNGYNDIWLSTVNNSYVLRGGEEIKMTLLPNEIINAVTTSLSCQLAVMRQE